MTETERPSSWVYPYDSLKDKQLIITFDSKLANKNTFFDAKKQKILKLFFPFENKLALRYWKKTWREKKRNVEWEKKFSARQKDVTIYLTSEKENCEDEREREWQNSSSWSDDYSQWDGLTDRECRRVTRSKKLKRPKWTISSFKKAK